MAKENQDIYKFITGVLIGIIIISIFFFSFLENFNEEKDIQFTLEDCKNLANEARLRSWNCQLELLREIYGIDYEPYLRDGNSCFYTISNGYCIDDATAEYYLNLTDKSCSKSFPKEEDVFAECLSKT